MAHKTEQRASDGARVGGARRLIAGLRVAPQDEALLAVVRPYLADTGSEGELAYRLWRRGLELTLAEVVGLGATLPSGTTEEIIASMVAQRLLLCMPLLRRTGTLARLGIEVSPPGAPRGMTLVPLAPLFSPATIGQSASEAIDLSAAEAISSLGGSDFL
ncbi:MAG: hypothetical protein HGA45_40865 [Chloroflexales bacterium]|nr:hypothetical protein [Chloroflexales bacterium]